MKDNFASAMKVELVFEGGKADDARDPGGRTNQGVTQAVFSAWCTNNGVPTADVYLMTADERDAIYQLQYAARINFDGLPAGIDLVLLDCAINSGPRQAVKWVQRALPDFAGKVDGVMGELTFQAIVACEDKAALITAILGRRLAFLKALKTWGTFGRGWESRVEQVGKIGHAWAAGMTTLAPEPFVHKDIGRKAELSDAKHIPSTAPGAGTAGIGAATAATTGLVGQIKAQLALIGFVPHVGDVMIYLDHANDLVLTGGGLLTIAGGLWFSYAKWRAARLHDALDTLPAASVLKAGAS